MVESESGTILLESESWIFPIWFLFCLNYRSCGESIEKVAIA